MSRLSKLIQISGDPSGPDFLPQAQLLSDHEELRHLVTVKNGFYTFESALHVFPASAIAPERGLDEWNSVSLWRHAYGNLTDGLFFFAEDLFGIQFAVLANRVYTFDPETGKRQEFARNLEDWADKILADYNLHTGFSLGHAWQTAHGPLPAGKRLLPKVPFVAGGQFSVDNLYAGDAVQGMLFRAELAKQIADLPDGAKIRFEITE